MKAERPLRVVFFKTQAGNEPVRDWLKALSKEVRQTIGEDILTPIPIAEHNSEDPLHGDRSGNRPSAWLHKEVQEDATAGSGIRPKKTKLVFGNMKKRQHRGSDFREFLQEDGILEEVESRALKRAIALQLEALRKTQSVSKTALAARMKTSRAAVDRLLDASNSSVTLSTLEKAARVFNRKLKVELVEV